jgi:ribonuclease HI
MAKFLRAYTDGSCLGQTDMHGTRYAGIGIFFRDDSPLNVSEVFELDNPTNIRAEFFAAWTAMKYMYKHYEGLIDENLKRMIKYEIYIDCKLVIDTMTNYIRSWKPAGWTPGKGSTGWMTKGGTIPKNLDIIVPMYELYIKFPKNKIELVKVKAHRATAPTDPVMYKHWYGNKKADEFATSAAKSIRDGR